MDNEKRVEHVVKGEIMATKRPRSVLKNFIVGNIKEVGMRILTDVIVPNIKTTARTSADTFVNGMLFGDSTKTNISSRNRIGSVSYDRFSNIDEKREYLPSGKQRVNYVQRSVYDYTDVMFKTETKKDGTLYLAVMKAKDAQESMREVANRYGICRVRDFYEIAEQYDMGTPNDNKFGWTLEMIEQSKIIGGGDAYYIDLPKPIYIEK